MPATVSTLSGAVAEHAELRDQYESIALTEPADDRRRDHRPNDLRAGPAGDGRA